MARRKKKISEGEAFVYRVIATLVGLVVASIFLRDRKEILASYAELKAESPFTAWSVKWAFIILMAFTALSVAGFGYLIYLMSIS